MIEKYQEIIKLTLACTDCQQVYDYCAVHGDMLDEWCRNSKYEKCKVCAREGLICPGYVRRVREKGEQFVLLPCCGDDTHEDVCPSAACYRAYYLMVDLKKEIDNRRMKKLCIIQ